MSGAFPLENGLTWQEWRSNTSRMESTQKWANDGSDGQSGPDKPAGTLANHEWADLERLSPRFHYTEQQLQPEPNYTGIVDCWSDEEARTILRALLDRFPLYSFRGFTLPPKGLPGVRVEALDEDDPAGKLICIGLRYAEALIRNEGRGMHRRWEEADEFIRHIEEAAELRVQTEEVERVMAEYDSRCAVPQLVYFIAAESGPIKIGMAIRPIDRLKTLQTSHHEKLELLATCEGGQEQERSYHKLFAAYRLHGEWFERSPAIEAEIARLNGASA